ncbi:fibronectin type III domain-containing protein [Treponema primitia]|uniref:fibronectin type III domain-containing protein n=1 Tax=Treponema primitia TaxID=88058 RepID=UPI000474AC7D|nr:5'-nucleotidase C-terminal domain-containing protein [Treponema primitia]
MKREESGMIKGIADRKTVGKVRCLALRSLRISTSSLLISFVLLLCLAGCENDLMNDDDTGAIPRPAPDELTLIPGDSKIEVRWTKVATATGYELYYSAGLDPDAAERWPLIDVNESRLVSALITGLTNGTACNVWVRTVFPHGVSDYSILESAAPLPPPETAPEFIAVESGDEQLGLSWNTVAGAASYEVYYSITEIPPSQTLAGLDPGPDKGLVPIAADTTAVSAEYLLNGLTNGSPYYLWVRAANSAGRSGFSTPISGTPVGAAAPPNAAVISTIIGGDRRLTLIWPAVSWAKSYSVYYSDTATPPAEPVPDTALRLSVTGKTVSAVISGLSNGQEYFVWVMAHNAKGDSPHSNASKGTPEAKAPVDLDNVNFVIGSAAEEFIFAEEGNGDRLTQKKETALANLYADGLNWYIREHPELYGPIDFVLLVGRYTRGGSLRKGTITVGTIKGIVNSAGPVVTSSPFTMLTLTADQVTRLFQAAAGVSHSGNGGHNTGAWGVVSEEVSYSIDYANHPTHSSGELVPDSLKINGEAPNRSYRIATLNYLVDAMDDLDYAPVLLEASATGNKKAYTYPIWQAVAEYVYQQDLPLHPNDYLKADKPRVTRVNDVNVK